MKLTKILPLIPTIALLASCTQAVKLSGDSDQLVSEKQTAAPTNFVVYPDDRPSIPDGKIIFEKQNCAVCHGAAGEGGSAPALTDKLAMSNKKPVDIYKFLTYGKPGSQHPALKDKLTNKEIWNLVFYAKSLGTPPLSTADMDVISPVFGSNCAVCHGTKGDGDGPLARNLEPNPADFQTFSRFFDRSDDTLYDHIANGIKFEGMPNFLGKADRKKNFKFDHDNINKLVAYVRNFQVSNEGAVVAAAPPASGSAAAPASGSAAAPASGSAAAPASGSAAAPASGSAAAPASGSAATPTSSSATTPAETKAAKTSSSSAVSATDDTKKNE